MTTHNTSREKPNKQTAQSKINDDNTAKVMSTRKSLNSGFIYVGFMLTLISQQAN